MGRQKRRQASYRFGWCAELLSCVSLWCQGFRVLGWRLRTALSEVDIVARRGAVVALIEVKARQDATAAALALSATQRGRITRAARLVLAHWPQLVKATFCFDVMLVTPWHWPQHQPNAWGEGL
ncbi:MAG: YraN family protein [Alphaproteobacteria bacterium]|nr:YraN family protein [Alphaproteobacteria bacterium]